MRTLMTTVMAAALFAGASVSFAAPAGNSPGFGNSENGPSIEEKQMMIDRSTTGSITRGTDSSMVPKDCISQRLDAAGKCIVDKGM